MSIIYLGANRAGVECLKEILKRGLPVSLVICRSKDSGKDAENFPSLKRFALSKKIPIIQPQKINSPDIIDFVRSHKPLWLVSVQYDQILSKEFLTLAPLRVNLHFAPLPKYRGCFPIPWALIEGNPIGVTLHELDAGIDTGRIIAKREVLTRKNETALTAYQRIEKIGIALFKQTFFKLYAKRKITGKKQAAKNATYHPAGYPFGRYVDWTWPAEKIERFVRAFTFTSFPSARTRFEGIEIEILHPVAIERQKKFKAQAGEIISIQNGKIRVQAGSGTVLIQRIKYDDRPIEIKQWIKTEAVKEGQIFS